MMQTHDELLDRFLDGDVSSDEAAQVIGWLESPGNLEHFAGRAELYADLRRSLLRRSIQEAALAECDEIALTRADSSGDRDPSGRSRVRPVYALAVAALVTAAALIIAFVGPGNVPRPRYIDTSVATLAYESNARWSDGDRSVGDAIRTGLFRLEVGIVRLDFANGATVTLQGPAEFEVFSEDRTRLHSGILTASIPDSAIGFEVETPAIDVIDLGTAFGVSVGADGETDVCVFEGEVEVSRPGFDDHEPARLLREGNAVRSSPQTSTIASVAYETIKFEDAWPVTSGVLQATGLMKFVAPGPEFVPGRYEDSERILVFLERSGVIPETEFSVDLVDPGQYQRIHRSEQHQLRTGGRIRSYLLQLDPVGRLERNATNKPRVIGQVTFDRPVIGLIANSTKLNATDGLLGHPRGDYVKARRGIEPPRFSDAPGSGRDVVILSADRRTLSVDLSAGTAVDQIRVVIDELHELKREH